MALLPAWGVRDPLRPTAMVKSFVDSWVSPSGRSPRYSRSKRLAFCGFVWEVRTTEVERSPSQRLDLSLTRNGFKRFVCCRFVGEKSEDQRCRL